VSETTSKFDSNLKNLLVTKHTCSAKQFQLILAEYNALRDELLQRNKNRYQIINYTLVISGTILTIGLQPFSPSYVLFVFPILCCFLADLWVHSMRWTRRICTYIRENIEQRIFHGKSGWDTYLNKKPYLHSPVVISNIFAASGVFFATELITMTLGMLKCHFTPIDIVLIVFDVICILATWVLLRSKDIRTTGK
jgi:hypothetical protein